MIPHPSFFFATKDKKPFTFPPNPPQPPLHKQKPAKSPFPTNSVQPTQCSCRKPVGLDTICDSPRQPTSQWKLLQPDTILRCPKHQLHHRRSWPKDTRPVHRSNLQHP